MPKMSWLKRSRRQWAAIAPFRFRRQRWILSVAAVAVLALVLAVFCLWHWSQRSKPAPAAVNAHMVLIAAGADGMIVEVHPKPEEAMSDGEQSLYPENFVNLMDEIRILAKAVGREL